LCNEHIRNTAVTYADDAWALLRVREKSKS